ncbi:MAG: hypothetical protein LBD93_10615, partial [Treponema sp.]|nr:hypothetical protein [Treponema sp.]
ISEDFHRFLPKLKRLKVFGNIIASMRTDAFHYKAAWELATHKIVIYPPFFVNSPHFHIAFAISFHRIF